MMNSLGLAENLHEKGEVALWFALLCFALVGWALAQQLGIVVLRAIVGPRPNLRLS